MDILDFEKKVITDFFSKGSGEEFVAAVITINGQQLLDLIREHEMPYAKKHRQKSIAGGYEYQFAEDLYSQLTDKNARTNPDTVSLLICDGCLLEDCWPLRTRVKETNDTVIWHGFYNPHRSDERGVGSWDY